MAKKQAYTGAKRGRKPKNNNPEAAGMNTAAALADQTLDAPVIHCDVKVHEDTALKQKVAEIVEAMLPDMVAKHVMDARLQNLVSDEIDRRMVVLTFRKPGDVPLPVVQADAEDQDIHVPGGAALR